METVCQPSYPLNSENASPFGTRTVYLAWAVSCAEMTPPPKTASTEAASETTPITTAGILLLFIATLLVVYWWPATARIWPGPCFRSAIDRLREYRDGQRERDLLCSNVRPFVPVESF